MLTHWREARVRALLTAALALNLAAPIALCQIAASPQPQAAAPEPNRKLPEFEVASVKPNPRGGVAGVQTYPGGRVRCQFCMPAWLMMAAFDVQSYQIAGDPEWIHREGYSIDAEPPASSESAKLKPPSPNSPLSQEQRLMLQAPLIDRFQLRFHRESRTSQIYLLTRGDRALKLQPPKDANADPWAGSVAEGALNGDGIAGKNISMPLLAMRLSRFLQHPVLDETGLTGSFDFKYQFPDYDPHQDMQASMSSIVTSLQAIGLNLKSTKGPVEMIVIDQVERPTAN
jgi:uncharacterized protein (TIGR03435 family)